MACVDTSWQNKQRRGELGVDLEGEEKWSTKRLFQGIGELGGKTRMKRVAWALGSSSCRSEKAKRLREKKRKERGKEFEARGNVCIERRPGEPMDRRARVAGEG